MTFEWPLALVGLIVVPLLVVLYVLRERRRTEYATRFTSPGLLPNLVDASPGWRRHLPLAVLLLALTAMVVGIARPHAMMKVKREEATAILVIDTSLSMSADDVRPTRLEAARREARAFLDTLPSKYRLAIVGFAGRAYVALPPTDDRDLAVSALRSLHTAEGTSLGDAVALATRIAGRQRASDGSRPPAAILVISDGAQSSGRTTPAAAALKARQAHIPVYSVLIGTQDGVITAPLPGGLSEQIRVPPSPDTLRAVSQVTGGRFYVAPTAAQLHEVYAHLGSRLGSHSESREVTNLFAGGSAALLLIGGGLSALWFRRVP
ncbi:MAG TPA: VWA domain-containing protein [Gaiellaceae bacterium]|nr:VWA domain-containing protein [Gaiellaceae bacterium]